MTYFSPCTLRYVTLRYVVWLQRPVNQYSTVQYSIEAADGWMDAWMDGLLCVLFAGKKIR